MLLWMDMISVNALIKGGADVNKRHAHGKTALTVGALAGNTTCFILLLQAGAHINIPNGLASNVIALCVEPSEFPKKNIAMVLFAAGEWLRENDVSKIPDLEAFSMSFKNLCRKQI